MAVDRTAYVVKPIKGDGFCVYRSLSYALCGDEDKFEKVIHDCLVVFKQFPMLYTAGVSFAAQEEGKCELDKYELYIRQCVSRLRQGALVAVSDDKRFYGENGHIEAISLLYDICIYVAMDSEISGVSSWKVFNKNASRGYVCLICAHEHVSVLHGAGDSVIPPRPQTADVGGHSRADIDWNREGARLLCSFAEPFPFVWQLFEEQSNADSEDEVLLQKDEGYVCDLCNGKQFKTSGSLQKHNKKFHRKKFQVVINLAALPNNLRKCDICINKFFCSEQDLTNHMKRCHSQSFKCDVCNDIFLTPHELDLHMLRAHVGWSCLSSDINASESMASEPNSNDQTTTATDTQSSNNKSHRKPCKRTAQPVLPLRKSTRLQRASVSRVLGLENCVDAAENKRSSQYRTKNKRKNQRKEPINDSVQRLQSKDTGDEVEDNEVSEGECESGDNVRSTDGCLRGSKYDHLSTNRKEFYKQKRQDKLNDWKHKFCLKVTADSHELLTKLGLYVEELKDTASDISTKCLSPEVSKILIQPVEAHNAQRKIVCDNADLNRLTNVTAVSRTLPDSNHWTWNAKMDIKSKQSEANDKRMQFWLEYDMNVGVLHRCEKCGCSDLLYGPDELSSVLCHDCMDFDERKDKKQTKSTPELDVWLNKIKPGSGEFPKRTELGHTSEYLPDISVAEKASIALVHPVTTIKRYYLWYKRYRCESITLSQDPDETWAQLLPRTDLKGRFLIIERTVKNTDKRYICVNSENVRQWLLLLFDKDKGHQGTLDRCAAGLLELSQEAIDTLKTVSELAEVDAEDDEGGEENTNNSNTESQLDVDEDGLAHASMHPILSENHVFAFEQKDRLYMNRKEALKIKDKGVLQFVTDSSKRSLSYNVSAKDAFPHLYHGKTEKGDDRMAPSECTQTTLAARMMRKLLLYPLEYRKPNSRTVDRLRWFHAEDDVHMAHQYAAIDERRINDKVGFFMHQRPESAAMDISQLLEALKQGADNNGIIDSNLPGLTQLLSTLHGSREFWYSERMGIETIARDLGDCNWFLTLNFDPRNDPHVRKLVWMLEHAPLTHAQVEQQYDANWHFDSTEHFSQMIDKHAVFISMLMHHKFETFMDALCDICQIPKHQKLDDWSKRQPNCNDNGWYFSRVEFTETRGVAHYHILLHLPNVFPTSLLGRIIQDGRVVREELKYGNIKPECMDQAWHLIEMGLLAHQYAINFVESVSVASFFTEHMASNVYDSDKVINLDALRNEYVENYAKKNISKATNPLMRQPGDPECDANRYMEIAKIAAVTQIHQCLPDRCGGNEGDKESRTRTCRFDYPKKLVKHTVVSMIQMNAEQMEAQAILRRTHARVNNCHPLIAYYWRANSDSTALVDSAHSKRYCTKYASKSSKHSEMYVQLLDELSKRGLQNLKNNVRHVLVQVFLASCSHRTFMSKLEIAHRVMQLPMVVKSYANVEVVGCYWRSTLVRSHDDVWVYSDRTPLAAYAERCDAVTEYKNCSPEEIDKLKQTNFKEFCETARCNYKRNTDLENTKLYKKHQLKTCEKGTGHWVISKRRGRAHVRFSTILNTDLACNYVPIDEDSEASYTKFMDMPIDKRRQLVRSFYELIVYEPWHDHPDNTFLSEEVKQDLVDNDPEVEQRYSLQRCERYYEVYDEKWRNGHVAPPGSAWHTDNQQAYTLYLVHGHNSDLKLRRADNDGRFNALMEPAEELVGVDVDVRPLGFDDADDKYPSVENFLVHDVYKDILAQAPPKLEDISVAYPSQPQYRKIEDNLRGLKSKRFIANPPVPSKRVEELTELQQKFIAEAVSGKHQVLYLTGVAGSGKTEVLLHVMQQLAGRVQACASTGIAAQNLNAPTLHGMLGLSQTDCSNSEMRIDENSTKCTQNAVMYEDIDVFIIDEVSMLPAHMLGFVEELMSKSFNPKRKLVNGKLLPFGGKRVILVGDPAQLPPINGTPFYLTSASKRQALRNNSLRMEREQHGLQIYLEHMRPNVTMLQRSHRSAGLLAEIADSLRAGTQTRQQLNQLELQAKRYSSALPDRGVHFTNDTAVAYNFRDLWRCSQKEQERVYICKASYYETDHNQLVCARLSSIAAQHYNFAPDLLCVYNGCEVRLVKNLDVSAGLVNGAIGTVVRVVYDNSDVKYVAEGKDVPPAYLIVDFPAFRGFNGDNSNYPFVRHPTWVPLIRDKFTIMARNLPRDVTSKQSASQCWRMQFPVDVSRHITTHRSQGSTISNQNILVDLNLRNPSDKVPENAGALLYVSITRATALKHLLVMPIFPTIWDSLGKDVSDDARRQEEIALKELAEQFAEENGYGEIVREEFEYRAESNNDQEWSDLMNSKALPETNPVRTPQYTDSDFEVQVNDDNFEFVQKPARSVRHIGIDQGTKANFAIVIVDHVMGEKPKIMSATVHDLQLLRGRRKRITAEDVIIALAEFTDLFCWMQLPGEKDPPSLADRVFVHVEQMSTHNPNAKAFGIDLATRLQQKSPNIHRVVVKLSQPNLHYASGPAFKLNQRIIRELKLKPVSYTKTKYTANPATTKRRADDCSVEETEDNGNTYAHRKQMSANIFRYIMTASDEQLEDMQLEVDESVKRHYEALFSSDTSLKLDDLGDATLHALHDILCGASQYKQALPKTPSVYNNRTIALTLFPDKIYWVVISCTWNSIVCESLGASDWQCDDSSERYLSDTFVDRLVEGMTDETTCSALTTALTTTSGNDMFSATSHIRVIVKQQSVYEPRGIKTSEDAGALTIAAVRAMRKVCDKVMGVDNSRLLYRKDKHTGVVYLRSNADSGLKMQVTQSTGKHLNAILCFLNWFKENLPEYVQQRRLMLHEKEKCQFFASLREIANRGDSNLEMLQLTDRVKDFLLSGDSLTVNDDHVRNFSDLLLMAISKNQQHVKAVAAHYREKNHVHTSSNVSKTSHTGDVKSQARSGKRKSDDNEGPSAKRPSLNE
jgi:hypothetical protein